MGRPLSLTSRIFAIGDLHLPGGEEKPMTVFGDHWEDHFARISADWMERVGEDDVVLLPGDISWAMYLKDAMSDLLDIAALPGQKIMIRGNHDYWWNSITKIRDALPPGFYALQNDALLLGDVVYCGTRGWNTPISGGDTSAEDEKIYARELQRLELSLQAAQRISKDLPKVAMLHFPPLNEKHQPTGFFDLLSSYDVHTVVYGHLHDHSLKWAFSGLYEGMWVFNTSCDGLGFRLLSLHDAEAALLPEDMAGM